MLMLKVTKANHSFKHSHTILYWVNFVLVGINVVFRNGGIVESIQTCCIV